MSYEAFGGTQVLNSNDAQQPNKSISSSADLESVLSHAYGVLQGARDVKNRIAGNEGSEPQGTEEQRTARSLGVMLNEGIDEIHKELEAINQEIGEIAERLRV